MMFSTGIEGQQLSFVLTDTQIIDEAFLEDINNLLNTGEVPNLMEQEDKDKIINGVRPVVIKMKRIDTIDIINSTFIERVRDNLHIILCMSPVGDSLRVRCRQFPSLVNTCTLDWFSRWPEEALLYVSSAFLKDLALPNDEVRNSLAEMCKTIHTSVEEASDRFYNQLRRRVYTTPKSYLDLINLYLIALDNKRQEFNMNKNRLSNGLLKLKTTNGNIAELKVKLAELQPMLKEKNEELKIALERVNADKLVANEKEQIVSAEAEIVNKQASDAQEIVDDVEKDLKEAKPELDSAKEALAKLDKSLIQELRSFNTPHELIVLVMEALMVLFGQRTDWNTAR
jgi:dynein heavy chain